MDCFCIVLHTGTVPKKMYLTPVHSYGSQILRSLLSSHKKYLNTILMQLNGVLSNSQNSKDNITTNTTLNLRLQNGNHIYVL